MKIRDVYSRKSFEYTIVGKVKHESFDMYVYTIMQREYGQDAVSYFVQYGEFVGDFSFQYNDAGEEI